MNSLNIFFYRLSISKEEKRNFIENLNLLLSTGTSTADTFRSIRESEKGSSMQFFLNQMIENADSGISLSETLEISGIFPSYTINLVRIGEKNGTLKETLALLSEEQSKSDDFRGKVKSAMLYPGIVLFFGLVVSMLIAWFMLPKLAGIFSALHVKLPLITKIILFIGTFLGKYGYIAVPLFFICILFLTYVLFFNEKTKRYGQAILFNAPGIGNLLKETEIARLGYLLGSLLNVGVPITSAILTMKEASPLYRYKNFYHFLADSIEEGNSFEEGFKVYKNSNSILPIPVQTLIISGEKTGKLPDVLKILGEKYNQKSELSAKNLEIILEPIFLIIVWFVVVGIALAVILPIYSIIGGVSHA